MSIGAARGNHKAKTAFCGQLQREGTEQGFHLLSSGSTAAPKLQAGTGDGRLWEQRFIATGCRGVSAKNCNVNGH